MQRILSTLCFCILFLSVLRGKADSPVPQGHMCTALTPNKVPCTSQGHLSRAASPRVHPSSASLGPGIPLPAPRSCLWSASSSLADNLGSQPESMASKSTCFQDHKGLKAVALGGKHGALKTGVCLPLPHTITTKKKTLRPPPPRENSSMIT